MTGALDCVAAAELQVCDVSGRSEYDVVDVSCLLWKRPMPCPCDLPVSVVVATTTKPHGATGAVDSVCLCVQFRFE